MAVYVDKSPTSTFGLVSLLVMPKIKSNRELHWKPTLYTLTFCMCCIVRPTQHRALVKRLRLAVTPARRKASLYGSTRRIPLFFLPLHIPQPLMYQLSCFYCRLDLVETAGSYRSQHLKLWFLTAIYICKDSQGVYPAARHTCIFIWPRMEY